MNNSNLFPSHVNNNLSSFSNGSVVTTHTSMDKSMTSYQIRAFRHIAYYASKNLGYCYKTKAIIAKELGYSLSFIEKLLRKLRLMGWIKTVRKGCTAGHIYLKRLGKSAFKKIYGSNTGQSSNTIYKKGNKDPLKGEDKKTNLEKGTPTGPKLDIDIAKAFMESEEEKRQMALAMGLESP